MEKLIIPKFNAEEHTYHSELGYYTPVSNVVKHFTEPFDKEFWSDYKAIEKVIIDNFGVDSWSDTKKRFGINKVSEYFHRTLKNPMLQVQYDIALSEILNQWKNKNAESIEYGNRVHQTKENLVQEKVAYSQVLSNKNHKTIIETLLPSEYPDGVYTEMRIWSNKYMICGTSDKVKIETIGNIRFVDIHDYKSNEKLDMTAYKGKKMKSPFTYFEDCKFGHYQLQLNIYGWLLTQWGFVVRDMTIEHTRTNQIYLVNNVIGDIEKGIKIYKQAA